MLTEPVIFVVDDDQQSRNSVCILGRSMGLQAEPFASAEEFLEHYREGMLGCVVTDVRMLGMSGLELLTELHTRQIPLPVVVITAYARTSLVVEAMQNGALTLLEKPYDNQELWDAIRKGIAACRIMYDRHERCREIRGRLAGLTPAQKDVLHLMLRGKPNKAIAHELDVSLRTVECRRSEVFAKMQVDSIAELVRLVVEADLESTSRVCEKK